MRLEAIKLKSRPIFEALAEFEGFYLAGGTALALQIGHRISVDFDLFSEVARPENLLDKVHSVFRASSVKTIINTVRQLTLNIDGVQLTFLTYPFPILLPLVQSNFISLLAVPEIAAAKAYALGRRATFKDYVDLYFVVKEGWSGITGIIDLAEKKYQDAFNRKLFLEELVYLRDIATVELEFLKKPITKERIERLFREKIRESALL